MKIICLNNNGYKDELTVNKIYLAEDTTFPYSFDLKIGSKFLDTHYLIKNNLGDSMFVLKCNFATLIDFRNDKIDKILK